MMRKATVRQLVRAVKIAAETLGSDQATYIFDGRISIPLTGGWALTLSPDDAGRLRLEACLSGRVVATMWCLDHDDDRLRALARSIETETAALTT